MKIQNQLQSNWICAGRETEKKKVEKRSKYVVQIELEFNCSYVTLWLMTIHVRARAYKSSAAVDVSRTAQLKPFSNKFTRIFIEFKLLFRFEMDKLFSLFFRSFFLSSRRFCIGFDHFCDARIHTVNEGTDKNLEIAYILSCVSPVASFYFSFRYAVNKITTRYQKWKIKIKNGKGAVISHF